ncbi:MAG TPA: M20/M25/M40 family metallo-hydrolase [Terriglobales bacterium]
MSHLTIFEFLRGLMELDSTSGQEGEAARYVAEHLRGWGGWEVELWPVEHERFNVYARRTDARGGAPQVVMSTHLDTVPPYWPWREDATTIYGRGACDAKGIVAAQVFAAQTLAAEGVTDIGLLFVVGEERSSAGAIAANRKAPGSRFLVNGEPTESRMIRAAKGALRLDLRARGRAAHSGYPELGRSAIEALLAALARLNALALPSNDVLGATTINVGTIAGGRAPNVVADEARAELLIRLVEDAAPLRERIREAVGSLAEVAFVLEIPPIHLRTLAGFETGVVAFATDIPKLEAWGEPLLFGPGSITVAHTSEERIEKRELLEAVGSYAAIVRQLLTMP